MNLRFHIASVLFRETVAAVFWDCTSAWVSVDPRKTPVSLSRVSTVVRIEDRRTESGGTGAWTVVAAPAKAAFPRTRAEAPENVGAEVEPAPAREALSAAREAVPVLVVVPETAEPEKAVLS
jgi:hypothetical protein